MKEVNTVVIDAKWPLLAEALGPVYRSSTLLDTSTLNGPYLHCAFLEAQRFNELIFVEFYLDLKPFRVTRGQKVDDQALFEPDESQTNEYMRQVVQDKLGPKVKVMVLRHR